MNIKRRIKKTAFTVAVSAIVFASTISFTACGKSEDKKSVKEDTPEYVYEADFKELGSIKMDSISRSCFSDGNIYMAGSDIEYTKDYEITSSKNYLLKCSAESENIDKTEISGLKDNEYVNNIFLNDENVLSIITSIQSFNKKTNENKTAYYMMKLDEGGKTSDRIEIKPDKKNSEDFYLSDNIVFFDKKLFVYFDKKVYTFNDDGSFDKTFEVNDYIESMFTANNGKLYIMSYMASLNGIGIAEFDTKTGKIKNPVSVGNDSINNVFHVKETLNGNVYLSNDNCLYEFDFEKGKADVVFNWLNVDIDGINISDFMQMEDGSILVLNVLADYTQADRSNMSSEIEIATISKKKYSETKQKKKLTLASNYLDLDVKREILKFNKTDDNYHIDVEDYSSYEDSVKQMNLDISAGKIPDIIDMGYMPKDRYIKKGFLVDLYPFIDKDSEIKKEDFIDTVRTTLERDGKLYYLPTSFMVNALAGSKKIFGDTEGWSYEDMEKAYNDMPEGSSFMYNMTSEWFVENMLSTQMDNFINYDTGEVKLDSEEFISMIEFSKNFKTNNNDNSDDAGGTYVMSSGGMFCMLNVFL